MPSELQEWMRDIPRFCLKLKGTPEIVRIEAATLDEVPGINAALDPSIPSDRVAKDADGNQLGWFSGETIAGWWIEPDTEPKNINIRFVEGGDKDKSR